MSARSRSLRAVLLSSLLALAPGVARAQTPAPSPSPALSPLGVAPPRPAAPGTDEPGAEAPPVRDELSTAGEAALTLGEVLDSARQRYPMAQAAQQDVAQARGAAQEAAGGFDLAWRTRATITPLGYYRNRTLDTQLELPTQLWGLRAFGGWRIGDGSFAPYYGMRETLSRGEVRAGAALPLLRGGATDARRTALRTTELGVGVAEAGVTEKQLDFARTAAQRYWSWVAAGQKLKVAQTLLARAIERDAALAARVERGDLASIERVDNTRAILQRQAQVVTAERALTQTSLALSLYLRGSDGQPLTPSAGRLPPGFPEPARLASSAADRVPEALGRRPEVRRLDLQRQQLDAERALHRNSMLPAIDFQGVVSKDMGTPTPSTYAREPLEVEVSVMIDVPIQNRVARGKLAQAEAKLAKNEAEARLARDRVAIEVRDTLSAVDAAYQRVEVARRELSLARQLEQAERRRFTAGDSTLLVVNLREQATFEAAQREVDALADYHSALAAHRAALGDL